MKTDLPPPFFQILSNPPSFPVTSKPIPTALSLAVRVIAPHLMCYFTYIMDLHISSLGTLVPKGLCVCFMQQGIKFTEVWHMCFFAVTLT